ncbi:hypothetical protein [Lactococcus garvieae]|uniref:hypothetical protein n=1 Tax=Lactococcus garvieae TaxID=1363 RepID=UPI00398EC9CA
MKVEVNNIYNIPNLKQVIVCIESYNNFYEELYIKDKLQKFFSPDIVLCCESRRQADIIITNCLGDFDSETNIFYWVDVFDDSVWKKLIGDIMDITMKR